ncbi:hypothetical protein BASA83_011402 [Batrachochytrium salamandrivorans]|nr:hypothetical protein BASA83_011402 [Batrachochytrium salamandrivorans]
MFDSLLWVLPYLVIHYAGQNTQGDKNDGGSANQASGSNPNPKKVPSLPPRPDSSRQTRPLPKIPTSDQSGASSSADSQPRKDCTGGHGIRKTSRLCPQPPSPSGSQPSTSHVLPKPGEMTLPVYLGKSEAKPYLRGQKTSQYDAFIASEIKYAKLEYPSKKKLSEGDFGKVYLATRKSDGMEVIYKSIPYEHVDDYTFEPSPPPICHLRNSLAPSKKTSVTQCMSSRPPKLLLSYEPLLQMYLSRPGHENPYVPTTFDYIALKNKFVLVMEYFGRGWVTLFNYVEGKERPDIVDARDIIKKIVEAMAYLKRYGILHLDVRASNVMYNPKTRKIKLLDFGVSAVLPGWKGGKSLPLKSPDLSSTSPGYKAGDNELISMKRFGQLIYTTIISKDALPDNFGDEQAIRKSIPEESDPYKRGLREKAIRLILVLVYSNPRPMHSIEAILKDPFFN